MLFSRSFYRSLPEKPGVYIFLNKKGEVIYVGKAKNLKKRVSSYFINKNTLGEKTLLLLSQIEKIKIITVFSEIESLLLEANLIKKYKPFFNIRLTDGKAYPLIKITVNDRYPAVLIVRRKEEGIIGKGAIFFGPFPNSKALRLVLKTLRKIFPYQSTVNHPKKICLYNHLGLCPCLPVFGSEELEKAYKKNIRCIIKFLQGDIKKVIADLEKERDFFSNQENFEKALEIQNKINLINLMATPTFTPFEYELNPNLSADIQKKRLNDFKKILNSYGLKIGSLNKIECYDVSNISGKAATGSMIVFINGEKEKSLYRKFKIISKNVPDDFKMIHEVLLRRLKHTEWFYPDLIIVDGGKGQVSAGLKAIKKSNLEIPIIGLAKRNEIIITSDLREIILAKDSNALLFLMSARDEAHRFAVSYHRKLRSRLTFV